MPGRMMGAPASFTFLEWGENTAMPRSSVRDVAGVLVFTGSPVTDPADRERVGLVTRLIDVDRISVKWEDGERPQQVAARRVRVTGPFVTEFVRDLRPNAWTGEGWRVDPFALL